MITYAPNSIAVEPEARPSNPSVRFTPLDDAAMMMKTQRKKKPSRSIPVSRMNDRSVDPPATRVNP